MTDLTQVKAATTHPTTSLRQAEQMMIFQGVRMLFVVTEMPSIEGLITATFSMERENSSLKEQLEASRIRSEKLKHEIEAVRIESLTDALTQVGNRQHFDDTLTREIARASQRNAPVAFVAPL